MENIEEIIERVKNEQDLEIDFRSINDNDFQKIFTILRIILNNRNQLYLVESIFMILKEILINAFRAAAKREYFITHGLDINIESDYRIGIVSFKRDILSNWNEYQEILHKSDYYFKLKIFPGDTLRIDVINNYKLSPFEIDRIQARINAADKYDSLISAYSDYLDKEESAGLGIIMMILILRSIGLGKENLKFEFSEDMTTVGITIPSVTVPQEITNIIREKILQQVDILPSLPDSLQKIINICNSENMDFNKLAIEIERNPALCADLLKLSNSPFFFTKNKVKSVLQAIKLVGSRNILNMLYAVSSYKIMKQKFLRMEKEWEHANQVSFYSSHIAFEFGKNKQKESIAVGGLLHDLGKILLLSVEGELFNTIVRIVRKRHSENTRALEEATIGISHSSLGSLLAKKWLFSDELTAMIEYHQQPYMAPEVFRESAEIVYLANIIASRKEFESNYYLYDEIILSKFNINNEEEFLRYCTRLEKLYEKDRDSTVL